MDPNSTLDIVVIGAGLSGINAAYRLQKELPHRSFIILESRTRIGGTWDFWKYPGARTDSSMVQFGFDWYPWRGESRMAEAPAIRQYLEDAAVSEGIDKKIQFGHRVTSMSWSSEEQRWTLEVEAAAADGSIAKVIKAWFVIGASGYYSYEKPLPAEISGIENFGGKVIHPQFWDENVDYDDKRVVVIGSGATAITLIPALAKTAAKVTMLQRSPTYVFSLARKLPVYFWSKFLPVSWCDWLSWWMGMFIELIFTTTLKTFPGFGRNFVRGEIRKRLPKDFDVDRHFDPPYRVFDQRLCYCPSGDFFRALRQPNTEIVTDIIETVTETGIQLKSGQTIETDIIVTATGLYLQLLNGISVFVDGIQVDKTLGQRYVWQGAMVEGIPNAGLLIGYIATSWTPGADVRARQLIKVIKRMEKTGATSITPVADEEQRKTFPKNSCMPLSSTYAIAGRERIPMSAFVGPWRFGMNWASDIWNLKFGSITDGARYTYPTKSKSV
jgi:cation diffusion facilitator CzcD-associated flavoprotein CzcO